MRCAKRLLCGRQRDFSQMIQPHNDTDSDTDTDSDSDSDSNDGNSDEVKRI